MFFSYAILATLLAVSSSVAAPIAEVRAACNSYGQPSLACPSEDVN
jgi:hypothetical protein